MDVWDGRLLPFAHDLPGVVQGEAQIPELHLRFLSVLQRVDPGKAVVDPEVEAQGIAVLVDRVGRVADGIGHPLEFIAKRFFEGFPVDEAIDLVQEAVLVFAVRGNIVGNAWLLGSAFVHAIYQTPIYCRLRHLIAWCVAHRRTVVCLTALLFIASIVGFSFVSRQFFPSSTRPELLVELRLPAGSAFKTTAKAVEEMEKFCKADQEVKTYTSYIGSGAPRWFLPMNSS